MVNFEKLAGQPYQAAVLLEVLIVFSIAFVLPKFVSVLKIFFFFGWGGGGGDGMMGQGTGQSTKRDFHCPVSQCLSLELPRGSGAIQANSKTGRQI